MTSAPANWHLQRTRRKRGLYYQAVLRSSGERLTVTLGYLDEDQAAEIEEALQDAGHALARLTRDQIKAWALEPGARNQLMDVGVSPATLSKMTFREFVETEFRAWRQAQVAEGTWSREEPRLNRLVDALGHVKLTNLTAHRWDRYLMGRDVAPRTKKLEENTYKEVLKRAHYLGAVPSIHPFASIRGATKRSLPIEPLTADEVRKLLDATPKKLHRALFALTVGVGLRPQEVVRVRWEDIEWKRGLLRVRGTKTEEAAATIPMTLFAMEELDAWREDCGDPEEGLVFTWGGKPIGSFKTALKTAAAAAGIDRGGSRRVFPNLLRHSFASMAASSGVPIIVAQQIMRHSSSKMLLEVYAKAGAQQLREGLESFPLQP